MRRILTPTRVLFVFCVWMYSLTTFAQEQSISGKVIDSSTNEPLIGATVIIKGTTTGATTDLDGNFTIQAKDGDILQVSFVGYLAEELMVSGQTTVKFSMSPDLQLLEEIVVIGYGTVKKADATGAVAVVSEDDFNIGTNNTPQDLIVGKVAGVVVTPGDGAPTSGAQIRIRGGSSLSASNDPLIVIDGLPVTNEEVGGAANPLSSINPNDIESMTVLKDASATAIYGSRASNGVIIVTTKKGTKGKIKIGYNGNVSLATIAKMPVLLNGNEFRAVVEDRVTNHGLTDAALDRLGTSNTDWQEEIYKNSISTDHNLSISGSPKGIPFRASLGYTYSNGLLKESGFNRGSASINTNPTFLDDHLKVSLNIKATSTNNRFSNSDAIGSANEFDPTQPVTNGNTRFGGYTAWTEAGEGIDGTPINIATHNPAARLAFRENTSNVFRSLGNVTLDYKMHFLPELRANLNLGYDYINSVGDDQTSSLASWSDREPERNVRAYDNTHKNELFEFYFNYSKEIPSIASKLDITAGYAHQYYYKEQNNSNRDWEPDENNIYQGADTVINKWEYYTVSFFGRLNYSLLNRFLFTATLRRDGSSRFGEDNRWGLFPSFSLAWKINEEAFMEGADAISELKIRAGYGVTGQQDIGNTAFRHYYPYLAVYESSLPGASYQRGDEFLGTIRPGAYDENLKWEETTTMNIGFDFGLYNNRFTGTFDLYSRETKDLINQIPIAAGTNFSNELITNIGSLTNEGVEFSLNAVAVSTVNLSWSIGANFTYNKNTITKLSSANDSTFLGVPTGGIAGGVGNTVQMHQVGYAANTFFLFKQVYDVNGMPIEGLYIDKTGEGGVVDGNDANRYYMENPTPDYVIGINTNVRYKNFDFGFSGRINIGNFVYNNNNSNRALYQNLYNQAGYLSNIPKSITKTRFVNAQYWSDIYLEDASFFRMDNISLGYSIDRLFTEKISGRFVLTVQNAFVISKYSGLDPEVFGGIDNNIYPRPRTFIFGFNLDF